jgi:hypothetical protein
MYRLALAVGLAIATSTVAGVLPAHALKPGFEKSNKTCAVKKICQQYYYGHRPPGVKNSFCVKWKEIKICD